ncbi:MAG TPA: TetR family transcriptional regulator [Streptosporangiaceae bacterium]|nr:TetR family transcriptional regulator [Streptosporangiaceae bacterium]
MEVPVSQITSPAAASAPSASPGQAREVPGGPDRRQRKKRRTRDDLVQAALALFEAKGYDRTAVHEITEAVDVSERTFFRYFASKEDLVLSFVRDGMTAFAEALAARPPQEEPLTATRGAFQISLRHLVGGTAGDVPSYLSVIRLIDSTPTLLAAHLRYIHEREDEVVRVLAQREGVDPAIDRRPRLLAAMIGALVFLANRDWQAGDNQEPEAMAAAFDGYADEIASALSGHWTAAR